MKTTILRKRINKYRTMETAFLKFPDEINVRELEYIGYLQGIRTIYGKEIDFFNFDTISFISESINKKSSGLFIHCEACRHTEKSITIVIFKIK